MAQHQRAIAFAFEPEPGTVASWDTGGEFMLNGVVVAPGQTASLRAKYPLFERAEYTAFVAGDRAARGPLDLRPSRKHPVVDLTTEYGHQLLARWHADSEIEAPILGQSGSATVLDSARRLTTLQLWRGLACLEEE